MIFQNNPCSGLIILIGLIIGNPYVGFWVAMGSLIATLVGLLLGLSDEDSKNGLHGFNGCLTSGVIALMTNQDWDALTSIVLLLWPAITVLTQVALVHFFSLFKVPAFTMPFVITTWIFLSLTYQSDRWKIRDPDPLSTGTPRFQLKDTTQNATDITWSVLSMGILNSFSQVYFVNHWISGILILLAIFLSSPRCAVSSFTGSLIGVVGGALLGASEKAISSGLWGNNTILSCVAIYPIFLPPNSFSFIYSIMCGFVTLIVNAAMMSILAVWGLPSLTFAFIVSAQLFLVASRQIPKLRAD